MDFIVCAVLMNEAPGTRLIQFEILVTGMDDRLKPRVAVIALKGPDEKEALQLVYHHH